MSRGRTAATLLLASLVTAAIFAADYRTGSEISLSFFYLFPVALATWVAGRRWGLVFSLMAAGGWASAYGLERRSALDPNIATWNVAVELAIFVVVTLTLSAVKLGLARERSMQRELESAYHRLDDELRAVGDLQKSLLPAAPPELPRFRLAVHYATAVQSGGDYYDFFRLGGDRLGLLIADVSGHGSPAAVVMAMMRVLLHTLPRPLEPPERVLEILNRYVREFTLREQFVTACFAILGGREPKLEYAIAGHNPPLLVRGHDGTVEVFKNPEGPLLGPFPRAVFSRAEAVLRPGDTVLFYTDGLTEAMDPEGRFLGEERVMRTLVEYRCLAPAALLERLLEMVRAHVGGRPLSDDMTLIVLRAA